MSKLYRFESSRDVDAAAEVVWEVVSDHAHIARWLPLRRSELESEGILDRNGVGAIRALVAVGPPIREQIIAADAPKSLRYVVLSGLPVDDYTGEISIEPKGDRSRLTWAVSLRPRLFGAQYAVAIGVHLLAFAAARQANKIARS